MDPRPTSDRPTPDRLGIDTDRFRSAWGSRSIRGRGSGRGSPATALPAGHRGGRRSRCVGWWSGPAASASRGSRRGCSCCRRRVWRPSLGPHSVDIARSQARLDVCGPAQCRTKTAGGICPELVELAPHIGRVIVYRPCRRACLSPCPACALTLATCHTHVCAMCLCDGPYLRHLVPKHRPPSVALH